MMTSLYCLLQYETMVEMVVLLRVARKKDIEDLVKASFLRAQQTWHRRIVAEAGSVALLRNALKPATLPHGAMQGLPARSFFTDVSASRTLPLLLLPNPMQSPK